MIFLGLASNYNFRRILRHLLAWGTRRDSLALRRDLAARYGSTEDQIALFHTGRSALAAALAALAEPDTPVILPGLTCIAVVRAVRAAGCTPVFSDIDPKTLQYDYKALDKTLEVCYNEGNGSSSPAFPGPNSLHHSHNRGNLRPVILVQNTLGLTLDMQKLESLAAKHHALIVEDLAHCAGRFYPDGREVGTVGAAAALSFGKGKAIDTISGGAAIIRQPKSAETTDRSEDQPARRPRLSARLRDRWYPVFGGLARTFWRIGLGRVIVAACLKLHWIEKSADADLSLTTRLTHWQARLARRQLAALPKTPLRKHYLVRDRARLLQELKAQGYELNEIWYDTPVSPLRYADEADFPAERCPATVRVAEQLINLPTWYPEAKLAPIREIIKPYEVQP